MPTSFCTLPAVDKPWNRETRRSATSTADVLIFCDPLELFAQGVV